MLVNSLKYSGYLPDTSQLHVCLMKYAIIQVVPKLNPVVFHILLYMFQNCMSYIFNELNRLQLDPISLLVNFSHELAQIMTKYDFLLANKRF